MDQVQVESQTMPGVGDQYTAGSGPLEMLTSAQYDGRQFHFLYDESSVEAESRLHTGVGVGGGELRGDLQATTEDVDEGWFTLWTSLVPRSSTSFPIPFTMQH